MWGADDGYFAAGGGGGVWRSGLWLAARVVRTAALVFVFATLEDLQYK